MSKRHLTHYHDERQLSEALQFLRAFVRACPAGMGDREYAAELDKMLVTAIEHRFAFDKNDGPELEKLSFTSSVGVFHPLHGTFYSRACAAGGTYAAMWEKTRLMKPWKAPIVLKPDAIDGASRNWALEDRIARDSRVAVGSGVLLLTREHDVARPARHSPLLDQYGKHLWFCTSINDPGGDNERIGLSCYLDASAQGGRPISTTMLMRSQWDELMAQEKAAAKELQAETTAAPAQAESAAQREPERIRG